MNQEILELWRDKKYSAVKQLIGQNGGGRPWQSSLRSWKTRKTPTQFNRLFRLLPKETARRGFLLHGA